MPRIHPPLLALFVLLSTVGVALAQTPAPSDAARQERLGAILQVTEPGQQMSELEAFARQFPKAPELEDVYNAIIADAAQLNNDKAVLLYNEKIEALDPGNLAQRVKVLNLLLINPTTAKKQQIAQEAATFAKLVETKTQETPPEAIGPTRWRFDMARLRALANLFQGAAAQAQGQFPAAEKFLAASLQQAETEEAAEHLGAVYVAEGKIPSAIQSYALALALPGQTISQRAALREAAGKLYAQTHQGSQQGFGDLILRQFDEVAARDAHQQSELSPRAARNAAATQAGEFVLTDLHHQAHRLSAYRGKVVVVDFWATWCGPCKVEHPLLEEAARQFASNHDVIFISINEDEDSTRVAPFVAAQHWAGDTWLDAGLGSFLGVESLPTTLILGPQGAVVYRQEGLVPDTFVKTLAAAITRALKVNP